MKETKGLIPPPPVNFGMRVGMRLGGALIVTAFAVLTAAGFAACKVTGDSSGGGKAGFPSLTSTGIPYLSKLVISPDSGGEPLELSPAFDSNILLYETDLASYEALIGSSVQGDEFNIEAEVPPEHQSGQNVWNISYPGGQNTVQTITGGQAVVYVGDGNITTTYIVSFRDPALDKATLQSIDFNPPCVSITPAFNPDINEYTVMLPYTERVDILAASTQIDSYEAYNPAYKVDLGVFNKATVGVTATGYNNNSYTFNFQFEYGQESFLDSLSISSGHLEDPTDASGTAISFSRDITDYKLVIPQTVTDLYMVGSVNRGDVSYSDGQLVQHPVIGQVIKITANYGFGYTAKEYKFEIEKSDLAVAKLSSLDITQSNGIYSIKQIVGGVENGNNNLADGVFTYNINFVSKQGGVVIVRAVADDGAFMVLNWGTTESTNGEISRHRPGSTDPVTPPLYITVYKSDMLASTYTITFSDSGAKTPALLSNLNCYGFTLDGAFSGSVANYTGRVHYGAPFISLQGIAANANFNVRYSPDYTISSPQNGQEITVTVSGGPAYSDTQYKITVQLEYPVVLSLNYQYIGGGSNSFTFTNTPNNNNTQGTLFVPAFLTELTITSATATRNGVVLSSASIGYSPSHPIISWSSQADLSSKSLDISVSDVSLVTQTFALTIEKQPVTQTAMASGGDITFIDNGIGGIDEIHTFNYDSGNSTNGQTPYTFTMSRGAGLTGRMLVVAGGGGGGAGKPGELIAASGGGAGKLIYGANWTIQTGAYEIKVGAGGQGTAAQSDPNDATNNGKSSTVKIGNDTLTAPGGGAGGSHWGSHPFAGRSGGSGGGGAATSAGGVTSATIPSSFSGFTAYGNSGGNGVQYSGSGGGGAGGTGFVGTPQGVSGYGGYGADFDISGASVGYAGGGGGGAYGGNLSYAGGGRAGGGGWGTSAEPGTGSGGGGGGGNVTGKIAGGNGGSGIVIIRFTWSKP